MGQAGLNQQALGQFHRNLQSWYKKHGRHDLPWRNTSDPYAIYISEIMLQQTQVETVRSRFYEPFLKKFPNFSALAKASTEDVLSAWQGLGYYRRAGHAHKAAKQAQGIFPTSVEELMVLPGIGRNTAHAVAAFAYHTPVPVMEANVKRVICRVFALKEPNESELWEKAELLLNHDKPFDYNQAMMDIGSMVCTKRAPTCSICPAAVMCRGKMNPEAYPALKAKKQVPIRQRHIVVEVDKSGNVRAVPRNTAFLQGMYCFNELEKPPVKAAKAIGEIEQSYSHFTLQAKIYLHRQSALFSKDAYNFTRLQSLPMSMAEKKILQLLAPHVTQAA